jgi:2-iminobutanoate/2-iminopropanoate deaminase
MVLHGVPLRPYEVGAMIGGRWSMVGGRSSSYMEGHSINMDLVAILAPDAPQPSSGYSQAVRVGNMIVTSGFLGTAPDGSGVVRGGFEAEVRQALDNIRAVLRAAGCPMSRVIRTTVSLTDIDRFADMDAVYREYFSAPYPARNTIGVAQLWGGAQVGFDVWAVLPDAEVPS